MKTGLKSFWLAWVCALLALVRPAAAQTVTINGSLTNQVIDGFGANIHYWAWNNDDLKPVLDALIDQGGLTLFRVIFDNTDWEAINDNNNANVMNWDFYNTIYSSPRFEKLWGLIGYLNQKGITNGIMLNFQGPGPAWMGQPLTPGYEQEWAEMIASLLIYGRNTRHLQFNLVGPDNEPDLSYEGVQVNNANQYVTMLHDLVVMLQTNGLGDIRLVGPDRSSAPMLFVPQMTNDPVVMAKLAHFGLHSYSAGGADSSGYYNFISAGGYANLGFWVTEFNVWCQSCETGGGNTNGWTSNRGTAEYLLGHLANGARAGFVWEGYDSIEGTLGPGWSYWGLFGVNSTNAGPKTYTPRKDFYTLAQIAKFVPAGAQRITVSGSTPLQLLAFYETNSGRLTITGVNTNATGKTLSGSLAALPPVASLELYYTTTATNLCDGGAVPVTNGSFSTAVPADCVFTLTGFDPAKIAVTALITNPADGASFIAPANIPIQANVSTTNGDISNVEFFSGTMDLGDAGDGDGDDTPYGIVWSNVPPGNYTLTVSATNTDGNSRVSPAVHVTVLGALTQISVTPLNAVVAPFATQKFTAVASDALGNPFNPQPALRWSVSGGGTIDSNGLFTSDGSAAGPLTILAASGGISGAASVSVNLAATGTGWTWLSLTSSTDNTPQLPAPGINDGDVITDVLLTGSEGLDFHNAYEAAGIEWAAPTSVNHVVYNNGSFTAQDNGVFAAGFQLQFSPDGVTWTNAGPAWTVTPAYTYSSPQSSNVSFTFLGPITNIFGVRGVGQVRTSETSPPVNSWVAAATEVQAFLDMPALQYQMSASNVTLYWPGAATNFIVQTAVNPHPAANWGPLTNAVQLTNGCWSVSVAPTGVPQYFRLRR
jgi:O-glycosyl hydrolase